jgi:Flp pilus assembly protein TadD
MRKRTCLLLSGADLIVWLIVFSSSGRMLSAEVDSAPTASTNQINNLTATNPPAVLADRDVIQQAIEQMRREAEPVAQPVVEPLSNTNDAAAAIRMETLDERLGMVERTLQLQHQTELEAVQSSNRTVLLVAGLLAGAVLLGIFSAVLVLTRTINRISGVSARLSIGGGGGGGPAIPALTEGELPPVVFSQAEQVNALFTGAIERLEKRIRQMEQTSEQRPLAALENHLGISPPGNEGAAMAGVRDEAQDPAGGRAHGSSGAGATAEKAAQVSLLIGKGQVLLNLGRAEEALDCFDRAASLDPTNAETLVKRGMALEKLQKMEEAVSSYNRAIAADNSMTLAYLYKGAACNRLQRFREALECYEKALEIAPTKPVAS